jgi:hypothetical protein
MKLFRSCLLALILLAAVVSSASAGSIRQIHLSAKDLIYDPFSKQIYASLPSRAGSIGNSIVAIDPVRATIGPPIFVGSEPGLLAIADNGQYLYVALDGAASVRRVNLWTQMAGLQIPLGFNYGPNYAEDIEVLPGRPESIAVSKYNKGISPRLVHVAIYDDDVQRPQVAAGPNVIAFSNLATRLYGLRNELSDFEFVRWNVDETGIVSGDALPYWIQGFRTNIQYAGGRLYASNGGFGGVYDPEARLLLGVLPDGVMKPDAALGRVFVLTGGSGTARLQAYDWYTFLPLGSIEIPGVSGGVASLVRWGTDGLAFRTGSDQVFLVQSATLIGQSISVSLGLNPGRVAGGTPATGTVTLSEPAPADVVVTLASTNAGAAAIPAFVTVPAGATTATFPVATAPVAVATTVILTASSSGAPQAATLEVLPPTLTSITLDPTHLTGSVPTMGTVALSGPAPPSGIVVSLGSSNPSLATSPGSVTIAAGATMASFTITTSPVQTATSVVIVAATVDGIQTALLQLLPLSPAPVPGNTEPPHPPIGGTGPGSLGGSSAGDGVDLAPTGVSALTLQPNPVVRGRISTGMIALAAPAPAGGVVVTLASSNPALARVPAGVQVAAGATTAMFLVTTGRARVPTDVALFAAASGVTRTATLTVLPAGIGSITVRPSSVAGGSASTGTITLAYPAPAGGAVVALSSRKSALATVPASVTVPAGARTVTFSITTSRTSASNAAVISASYAGATTTARLAVRRR